MTTAKRTLSCALLGVVLVLWGCGSGGSGGSGGTGASATSSPSLGVYAGYIRDDTGTPVKGARVSVNGIEAMHLTGADGFYKVADESLAQVSQPAVAGAAAASGPVEVEVAVLAPGMEPRVATLLVAEGDLANVDLVRAAFDPDLTVTSPADQEAFVIPSSCSGSSVDVRGFARLKAKDSYRLDVVLVIDKSGSTGDPAFDVNGDGKVESVLGAEVAAARCFLGGLDPRITRVCAVTFADSAGLLHDFTSDLQAVDQALASVDGSSGGTNFEAALKKTQDLLFWRAVQDKAQEVPDEDPPLEVPAPFRAVVFLSDGIPTTHGVPRDPLDDSMVQDEEDRMAAVRAARSLGQATSAQLFAYSLVPREKRPINGVPRTQQVRRMTTLPHCVAACGGGRHEEILDVRKLDDKLCGEPLEARIEVEIANGTLGGLPLRVPVSSDGYFEQAVPISVVGTPGADHTVANSIQVTMRVYLGSEELTATKTVTVKLMVEATYANLGYNEIQTAQAAPEPVVALKDLKAPLGKKLENRYLQDFLVGAGTAEFEDAVELYGADTFTASDLIADTVTVTVDVAYKEACYRSDLGWFVIDPANPPKTPEAALASVTEDHVLCNTGDVGQQTCSGQSIPQGTASLQFAVPRNTVVAFFLLPNRRLAEYMANPRGGSAPLFTLPSLNPGGFDQVLSFRSLVGRTEPGPSQNVVKAGPVMIFAFEDMATANRGQGQDFNDIVIMASKQAGPRLGSTACSR